MDEVKRQSNTEARWGAALLVLATACAAVLLALPRQVTPTQLPTLTLPASEVAAQLAQDAEQSEGALSEAAQALDAMLIAQGEAEAAGIEDTDDYRARRRRLIRAHRAVLEAEGDAATLRLRAAATARFEDALALKLPEGQARAVIGALATVFWKEGVSHEGHLLAPRLVIRTLFKARWNLLHGLEPDAAFSRVEKRAFYGWQALHAGTVRHAQRIAALHAYGQAGGGDLEEAMGVLLYRARQYAQAHQALEAAYAKRPSLRLRNYVLGAERAAVAAERAAAEAHANP